MRKALHHAAVWLIERDRKWHMSIANRFPRGLDRIDRTLTFVVDNILSNALFAVILSLALIVMGVAGADILVLVSVGVAWLVTFLWIARSSKTLRKLSIASRLATMLGIGFVLAIVCIRFGTWGLGKFRQSQEKPLSASDVAAEVVKRLPQPPVPQTPKVAANPSASGNAPPSAPKAITGPLLPANDPDPELYIPLDEIEQLIRTGVLPKEIADKMRKDASRPISLGHTIPKDALKVYFASNVAYTTKQSAVVLRLNGKDLLSIHRGQGGGVSIDATVFGVDNRILVEVERNAAFINTKHSDYWRSSRPDPHTITIHDQLGYKALDIRYVNPQAIQIRSGTFRYSGRELIILGTKVTLNGRPWRIYGSVAGDSPVMFNF